MTDLIINGPVGDLEIRCETPVNEPDRICVVCHPHPLFQGTMHNKVAYMLARSFNEMNAIGVRFNFRGVGKSTGEHANGIGEVGDVIAVINWAREKWPNLPVSLCGFSFGAYVALLTVQKHRVLESISIDQLVTVAPPVGRWDFSNIKAPSIPWLVIQGDQDDFVDKDDVYEWSERQRPQPEVQVIHDADHFFHGKLNILKEKIQSWYLSMPVNK